MPNYELTKKDKTYVDLSLAFTPSPLNNDITTITNERAINNAIKNIVMTVPLEVPFNRNFGSRVTDYLFDVVDRASSGTLYLEIERSIKFCEPRVEVLDIKIDLNDDEVITGAQASGKQNSIDATITYKIVGSERVYNVSTILTPTR